jgi:transcriptional regulator with XRE-family HTH domain
VAHKGRGHSAPGKFPRKAGSYDQSIGARIRLARAARKVSQAELARSLGVAFQQVQKYENGTNRVSAGRLYEMARFLHVDVGYFFAGFADTSLANSKPIPPVDESTKEFSRLLAKIKDVAVRKRLLELLHTLADSEG